MELGERAWRPRAARYIVVLAGFVLSGLLGVIDYSTGHDLVLSALYVLPLALVTWHAGRGWGAVTAVVSIGIWLTVDIIDYQHSGISFLTSR